MKFAWVALPLVAVGFWFAPRAAEKPFVVHEWGTFTNFAGSDGVQLEFRPLIDSDLPNFVFDRERQAGFPMQLFLKRRVTARQRMETPVIYFYTDREREVDVRVEFPRGLLTEFYPPVASMTPDFEYGASAPAGPSSLDWGRIRLLPASALAVDESSGPESLVAPPPVEDDNHYAHARETDAALVEFDDPHRKWGRHYEKFLFYRGVGEFKLPLVLTARGEGVFELANHGPDPIRSLFLVEAHGEELRFSRYDQVAAGGTLRMTLAEHDQAGSSSDSLSSADALGEALVAALIDEGLYAKEARSMVATWRSSWFGEPGVRLLYMVPQRLTEEIIPLSIEPRPDELVRVLVGRMEVLSPETERQIEADVAALAAGDEDQQRLASAALERWGRFAEPTLSRLVEVAGDQQVRLTAERVLAVMKEQYE